jgi:SAM-dependent methyltransferase
MEVIDTLVRHRLSDDESTKAKSAYIGSTEQPPSYVDNAPVYAVFVSDMICSLRPNSVLEFGCNAGRNLDQIRRRLPTASLTGVDVNPDAVKLARELFGLHVITGDETWLCQQKDDAFDVSFTISVIDHIPFPETVLRQLLRVTRGCLVLFELAHDRLGKAAQSLSIDNDSIKISNVFRYSYIHDYRYECEKKMGASCILDAKFPIGKHNLLDLYRLYMFSKNLTTGLMDVFPFIKFS